MALSPTADLHVIDAIPAMRRVLLSRDPAILLVTAVDAQLLVSGVEAHLVANGVPRTNELLRMPRALGAAGIVLGSRACHCNDLCSHEIALKNGAVSAVTSSEFFLVDFLIFDESGVRTLSDAFAQPAVRKSS